MHSHKTKIELEDRIEVLEEEARELIDDNDYANWRIQELEMDLDSPEERERKREREEFPLIRTSLPSN